MAIRAPAGMRAGAVASVDVAGSRRVRIGRGCPAQEKRVEHRKGGRPLDRQHWGLLWEHRQDRSGAEGSASYRLHATITASVWAALIAVILGNVYVGRDCPLGGHVARVNRGQAHPHDYAHREERYTNLSERPVSHGNHSIAPNRPENKLRRPAGCKSGISI